MKKLVFLFLLGLSGVALAQTTAPSRWRIPAQSQQSQQKTGTSDQVTPKTVPLAPNAAGIARYGDVQGNPNSGQISPSVPLYEIKLSDFSLPIALNYASNGMKMGEVPGWVGLGWSLNAMGTISRQVRGIPDELESGMVGLKSAAPAIQNLNQGQIITYPANSGITMTPQAFTRLFLDNQVDFESDQFFFSGPGIGGSFFFDPSQSTNLNVTGSPVTRTATTIPVGDLTINASLNLSATHNFNRTNKSGKFLSFTVKDAQGNLYLYDVADGDFMTNTLLDDVINWNECFYNTWYLSRITTPNGNLIEFFYDKRQISHPPTFQQTASFPKGSDPDVQPPSAMARPSSHQPRVADFRLTQIKVNGGDDGTILFEEQTTDRTDWETVYPVGNATAKPRALNRITIRNGLGQTVRQFRFTYDPTAARLLLRAVTEQNGATVMEPHVFSYANEGSIPSYYTLGVTRFAEDYWGYFNGAWSDNMVPSLQFQPFFSIIGENKQPSLYNGQTGQLNRILYPTKGYTQFDYELNDYQAINNPTSPCAGSYSYVDGVTVSQHNTSESKFVSLSNTTTSDPLCLKIDYSIRIGNAQSPDITDAWFIVKDIFGQPLSTTSISAKAKSLSVVTGTVYVRGQIRSGVYVSAGLLAENNAAVLNDNMISVSISQNITTAGGLLVNQGGGLRIKRQKDCPATGSETGCLIKDYVYTDATGMTSGRLISPLYFLSEVIKRPQSARMGADGNAITVPVLFQQISSGTQIPVVTSNGNAVYYERVQIKEGGLDAGSNPTYKGSTCYSYLPYASAFDYFLSTQWLYPIYSPTISQDWKRGKPQSVSVLTGSNILLKETSYSYAESDFRNPGNVNLKIGVFEYDKYGAPIGLLSFPYGPSTSFHAPTSETATDYAYDGFSSTRTAMSQVSSYSYASIPTHHFQTRILTDNSRGETLESRLSYPDDLTASANTDLLNSANALRGSGRKSTVIRQEGWTGGQLTRTTLNLHKNFPAPNGPALLWKSQQLLGSSADGPVVEYQAYGFNGNPIQFTTNNGYPTTYVWAYKGASPVAEVKGATQSEVEGLIGSLASVASLTADSDITTKINQLRNGLPNALVTGFLHQPGIGVRSITTPNALTTSYEYDGLGRLTTTYDANGKKTKAYAYNYRSLALVTPLSNQSITAGLPAILTIPAGTFWSPVASGVSLNITGLPSGLTYGNFRITGSTVGLGTSTITVVGTLSDGSTAQTSFQLTVVPQEALSVLAPTYSCDAGAITLTFRTKGGTGAPIRHRIQGLTGWNPSPGPHRFAVDGSLPSLINLYVWQGDTPPSTLPFSWDWRAACQSINQAPVANLILSKPIPATLNAGLNYKFPTPLFTDPEGSYLTLNTTPLPLSSAYLTVDGVQGIPTQTGLFSVTVTATDPFGFTASVPISFSVQPSTATLSPLSLTTSFNCTTNELTFVPKNGNNGTVEFLGLGINSGWSTKDGPYLIDRNSSLRVYTIFARQVGTSVFINWDVDQECQLKNRSPYLIAERLVQPKAPAPPIPASEISLASQTAIVAQAFSYTLPASLFGDPDNDPLTLGISGQPTGLNLVNNRVITGIPGQTGSFKVVIKASDPYLATASSSFNLSVSPATTFGLLHPSYVCSTGSFTFNSAGGNATTVQYMAVGITGWTTNRGPYTVLPFMDAGPFTLNAQQSGVTYTYSWDWKAQCRTQNLPPVSNTAVVLPSQTANVGGNYTYTLPVNLFTDPEGQTMTYTVAGMPIGVSFNSGTGQLSGSPTQAGGYLIEVKATDIWGGAVTRSYALSVVVPPTLIITRPTYLCGTGEFWFNATGGNGTPVQYMAVGITGWTTNRGAFTVLPFSDAGPFTLNAQQSGVIYTYSWDWKAQCQQQNVPPQPNNAVSLPSLTVVSGSNASYTIPSNAFIDPDSPTLTYSATGLPSGLSLSGQTISGVTSALGTYTVTIKATDSYSATGSRTLILTVSNSGVSFQLLAPSYNCSTKAFYFNATAGNGTSIQYMAVGITGWTTTAGPYTVNPASDAGPFTLQAQQSGVVVTYSWNWKLNCP